jgi:hypothetical protein
LFSKIKTRVEGRAFFSAALAGAGVGACVGAAFLAGGLIHEVETQPVLAGAEQLSLRGPLPAEGASLTYSAGGSKRFPSICRRRRRPSRWSSPRCRR